MIHHTIEHKTRYSLIFKISETMWILMMMFEILSKIALVLCDYNSMMPLPKNLFGGSFGGIRFDQHLLFCISTFQKVVVKTINFFNENQVEFLIIIMQHSNHNLKSYRGALLRWSI